MSLSFLRTSSLEAGDGTSSTSVTVFCPNSPGLMPTCQPRRKPVLCSPSILFRTVSSSVCRLFAIFLNDFLISDWRGKFVMSCMNSLSTLMSSLSNPPHPIPQTVQFSLSLFASAERCSAPN